MTVINEFIGNILHGITSVMRVPVIVVLIIMMIGIVFCIGWVIAEYFTERRHMKIHLPALLEELRLGKKTIAGVIDDSELLKSQKAALTEITDHATFNTVMLESLASELLEKEQARYDKKLKITDTIAKLGPMLGLLGTLIPLGPGIIALGQGDTLTLSQSLATAFDTTIAGLIVAAIAIVISTVRRTWYNMYMSDLETVMDCVVEMIKEYKKVLRQRAKANEGYAKK